MKIDARLKRIEDELGIGEGKRPFVLLLGCKGGRKLEVAEVQRRIDDAIRARPDARFIMLLCGGG